MANTEVVSYSELDRYRQCPLAWFLGYHRRWTPPKTGRALALGTLWHQVLELHYRKLMEAQAKLRAVNNHPQTRFQRWQYEQWRPDGDISDEDPFAGGGTEALVATIWAEVRPMLFDLDSGEHLSEMTETVDWMYRGYLEHYGLNTNWTILAVEHAPEVWLPTVHGGRSRFKLKMKLDLVIREVSTGQTWVVDHKSGGNAPTDQQLDIDDQFGLYTWGLKKLGKPVLGAIHSYAKTSKLKRPMTLDERFIHKALHRGEKELDQIAIDAYLTARASRHLLADQRGQEGREGLNTVHSSPDPRQCGWKCDFIDAHLAARKGFAPLERYLSDTGYVISKERH